MVAADMSDTHEKNTRRTSDPPRDAVGADRR